MKCKSCNGEGEIWFPINLGAEGFDSDSFKCEVCDGTGKQVFCSCSLDDVTYRIYNKTCKRHAPKSEVA